MTTFLLAPAAGKLRRPSRSYALETLRPLTAYATCLDSYNLSDPITYQISIPSKVGGALCDVAMLFIASVAIDLTDFDRGRDTDMLMLWW